MWPLRITAIFLLIAGSALGYFVYSTEANPDSRFPFKLGLDLSGGSHLVYSADVSGVPREDREEAMEGLRDVIERRVNLFGVSEPIVQVEGGGVFANEGTENRLIVELPGVTEIDQAIALIGRTPLLEFKVERPDGTTFDILEAQQRGERLDEEAYLATELTGRFLEGAKLEFASQGNASAVINEPIVTLDFNSEGADIFAEMTRENLGRTIAIYLDGAIVSAPVVQSEITGGQAQITGGFSPDEARELARRLNSGALPVPIELLSTQTIGPSLGAVATERGINAALWGLSLVALFLVFWYRMPGVLAVIALGIYMMIMLSLFKVIPVTLTAAGIAGFILSIGMAVDANILIFERMKEELLKKNSPEDSEASEDELTGIERAIHEGFARAWLSIRDGNLSSIITAVILFWFGTSIVEGFALTFGLGVLVSMITAISVTKTFLYAVSSRKQEGVAKFLFGTGLK